jgi:hypothetical protein
MVRSVIFVYLYYKDHPEDLALNTDPTDHENVQENNWLLVIYHAGTHFQVFVFHQATMTFVVYDGLKYGTDVRITRKLYHNEDGPNEAPQDTSIAL